MPRSRNKDVAIYPAASYTTLMKVGDSLDFDIQIYEDLKLPLKKLDKVGKATIYKNGQILDEIDLIVHEDVKKERLLITLFRYTKDLIILIFSKIFNG